VSAPVLGERHRPSAMTKERPPQTKVQPSPQADMFQRTRQATAAHSLGLTVSRGWSG